VCRWEGGLGGGALCVHPQPPRRGGGGGGVRVEVRWLVTGGRWVVAGGRPAGVWGGVVGGCEGVVCRRLGGVECVSRSAGGCPGETWGGGVFVGGGVGGGAVGREWVGRTRGWGGARAPVGGRAGVSVAPPPPHTPPHPPCVSDPSRRPSSPV